MTDLYSDQEQFSADEDAFNRAKTHIESIATELGLSAHIERTYDVPEYLVQVVDLQDAGGEHAYTPNRRIAVMALKANILIGAKDGANLDILFDKFVKILAEAAELGEQLDVIFDFEAPNVFKSLPNSARFFDMLRIGSNPGLGHRIIISSRQSMLAGILAKMVSRASSMDRRKQMHIINNVDQIPQKIQSFIEV